VPVIPQYESNLKIGEGRLGTEGVPDVTRSTAPESAAQDVASADERTAAAVSKIRSNVVSLADHLAQREDQKDQFNAGVQDDIRRKELAQAFQDAQKDMPADGSGFHETFLSKADEIAAKNFQAMPPGKARQEYEARWQAERIGWSTTAAGAEAVITKQYATRAITQLQNDLTGEIQANPTPEHAEAAYQRGLQRIEIAPGLSPAEKLAMKDKWETVARTVEAQARFGSDPDAMRKALGVVDHSSDRVENALIVKESGGDPSVVNKFGFAGLYQFGAPRLETLGLYTPGANEDLGSWNSTRKDAAGKWTGTFNIPGMPEIKTIGDFLSSPAAQRIAFGQHTGDINKEIDSRGLDRYIGKTVGGLEITRSGIIAMAHLGGIDGAERALKGRGNARDANGSSVLDYAKLGQGDSEGDTVGPAATEGVGDPRFKAIPFNQRLTLVSGAEKVQAGERSAVAQLRQDDENSIATTGKPIDTVTPELVERAQGSEAKQVFLNTRAQAKNYYDNTHDLDQVPNATILQRVASLQPKGGTPGFDSQYAYWQAAQKRGQEIMKQRATDPAAAVDNFPAVAEARNAVDLKQPETMAALARQRAIAQRSVGLEPFPVTRQEALQIAAPLVTALPGSEKKILGDLLPYLDRAYGKDADRVLQFSLQEAKIDADTQGMAVSLFRKLHKNDVVAATDTARLQESLNTDAAARAAGVKPSGGTPKSALEPPDAAIAYLIQNPSKADKFDLTFGAGMAKKVLSKYQSMTVSP
jgi:hypothetical protein